jgi:hypothetical protein
MAFSFRAQDNTSWPAALRRPSILRVSGTARIRVPEDGGVTQGLPYERLRRSRAAACPELAHNTISIAEGFGEAEEAAGLRATERGQSGVLIGNLAENGDEERAVDGGVGERDSGGVGGDQVGGHASF